MRNTKKKYAVLSENEELELAPSGDFIIKKEFVEGYEIIDFHCHSYEGLCQLFPLFDLNKVYFSDCPTKLCSIDGLKTRIKLFTGAFVLNYATTERLLSDMDHNGISKAVIQQINPPDKNSADIMEEIVTQNERLYTF